MLFHALKCLDCIFHQYIVESSAQMFIPTMSGLDFTPKYSELKLPQHKHCMQHAVCKAKILCTHTSGEEQFE